MMRLLLTAAVFIAVMSFDLRPAPAYEAPWCAVVSIGSGAVHEDCHYNSIEECRPNVIAGNRGFCNQRWRPVVLIALVIAILILARVFGLADKLGDLRDWIKSLGALGALVFILIYVVAVVAAIPAAPISVAAAALFGSVWGVIVINIGATLGAGLAFLVGRYFAREAVVNWLGRNEKFRRLDKLTEEHGAIIVALTRLVPIFPFNLLNYGFGLTRVPFWTYIFWTWLCIIPGTVLYVVGADAVLQGAAQGKVPWPLVLAFGAALIFLTILVRFAKRRLQAREKEAGTGPDSHPGGPLA